MVMKMKMSMEVVDDGHHNDRDNDMAVPVYPVPVKLAQRRRRRRRKRCCRQRRQSCSPSMLSSSVMMMMMMVFLVVMTLTLQETTVMVPSGRYGSVTSAFAAAAVTGEVEAASSKTLSTSTSKSAEVQLSPGSDTPSSSSSLLAPSKIPGEKEYNTNSNETETESKNSAKKKMMMTVSWMGDSKTPAVAGEGMKNDSSSSSRSRSSTSVRNETKQIVQEQQVQQQSTDDHDNEKRRRRTTPSLPWEEMYDDGGGGGIEIMVMGRKMKGLVRIMLWRIACLSSWVRTVVMVIELLLTAITFLEYQQQLQHSAAATTTNPSSNDTVDHHLPATAAGAAAGGGGSPFAAAGSYTYDTLRCFRDRASYIHTTLTTYLVDYSSYLYNQLVLVDIHNITDYDDHTNDNALSVSSTNRIIIPAERDTVSNWTSQLWSNLTKGWSKMVDKIHLQSLSLLNSTNTSNEITIAGSRRNINKHLQKYWSVVSVSISRQTTTVVHFAKRVWPKVSHRIVSFVKVVRTRLVRGTRVPRKFLVRKWRQTKSFVVKNTKKLLSRIMNGLERIAVIDSDKGGEGKKQTTAAVQKEEKASYFASVGMTQPTAPVPEVSKPAQSSKTASTKKTSTNPASASSTLSGGTKKTKTTSNGKSTTELSSKPSIMDQLTGALSPKKNKESQVIPEEVDAEPNVLAGMFSSLASWGLYAAGGAAVVGYVVYNQYDSWVGGTQSHSSSLSKGTETDDMVDMEVDFVSTTISSATPTTRRMSARRMATRGTAEITPDSTK